MARRARNSNNAYGLFCLLVRGKGLVTTVFFYNLIQVVGNTVEHKKKRPGTGRLLELNLRGRNLAAVVVFPAAVVVVAGFFTTHLVFIACFPPAVMFVHLNKMHRVAAGVVV